MPINQLHVTLQRLLLQLRPAERITRIRNFSRLLGGLCLSRSAHLSQIANKIPTTEATLPSATRRLSRLLDNAAIRVRDWYEPIARSLLERAAQGGGAIRLIVDGSKIGSNHRLLMVGLAYRRRAIPVAWSWVRSEKGHSSAYKQRALLGYVRGGLAPDGAARVSVVGDSEFGAVEVLKQLEEWGWHYVLRQKRSHLVLRGGEEEEEEEEEGDEREPLGGLIERAGRTRWMENALLSRSHAHRTNLLMHWKKGEKEPWLLATDLPSSREARAGYKRRMWIEEMFADFKGHGSDLESTRLRHFERLSRLTLAVAMLYVWLVVYGAEVIKRGQRSLVDRSDRRDHSLFRLGYDMLDRCLAQGIRPFIRLLPGSLPKLSGG
jgi:Transposase DDE domain